jgi:hypothetical protein
LLISLTAITLVAVIALISLPLPEDQSEGLPQGFPASTLASDVWLQTFSLRAYRPMLRLAARDDARYLRSAGGRGEDRHHQLVQRALLRDYLHNLTEDFHRLYAIAEEKSRRAAGGQPQLPVALTEQRIAFSLLMWSVEMRLMLRALIPVSIDLQPLLASVESLAAETREVCALIALWGTVEN